MKLIASWLSLLLVILSLNIGFSAPQAAAQEVKVISFNIRMAFGEAGKPNSWKNRRDLVTQIIKDGQYDFVGIQEAIITQKNRDLNQEADLKELLPGYGMINRSRTPSLVEGESTPVMYRKDRWQADPKEQGCFWLSDTPDVPGSITWNNACPRTVIWARFLELKDGKPTGKAVYFVNTHYDHVSEKARNLSSVQILDFLAQRAHKDEPVILTGDLNSGERSSAQSYLKGETISVEGKQYVPPMKLIDTFRVVQPTETSVGTYHGYRETPYPDKIDYTYVPEGTKVSQASIIRRQTEGGLRPSDHFPIDATVDFGK